MNYIESQSVSNVRDENPVAGDAVALDPSDDLLDSFLVLGVFVGRKNHLSTHDHVHDFQS